MLIIAAAMVNKIITRGDADTGILGVFAVAGCGADLLINILLTMLG
jgi:hypothetical protein